MVVSAVRGTRNDESSRRFFEGTIVIELDNGRRLYFGPMDNDLNWLSKKEREEVIPQAAHLLDHSRGGSCWASDPIYDLTINLFNVFANDEGVPVRLS